MGIILRLGCIADSLGSKNSPLEKFHSGQKYPGISILTMHSCWLEDAQEKHGFNPKAEVDPEDNKAGGSQITVQINGRLFLVGRSAGTPSQISQIQ